MSETSHAAGRIAILTAFTLLFAAAWRGDAPVAAPAFLSGEHSGAGRVAVNACTGRIAWGARSLNAPITANVAARREVGTRASRAAARGAPGSPFSGMPALLGRSTMRSEGDGFPATAALIAEPAP